MRISECSALTSCQKPSLLYRDVKKTVMLLHSTKLPFPRWYSNSFVSPSHIHTRLTLHVGSIDLQLIYGDKRQSFSCDRQLDGCGAGESQSPHRLGKYYQHQSWRFQMDRVEGETGREDLLTPTSSSYLCLL